MTTALLMAVMGSADFEYPQPEMLMRADWGAQPMVLQLEPHEVRRITVHHTGVKANPERDFGDKLRGLQAWSQREDALASGQTKPQWADIPYHYYIDVHGEIAECRPVGVPGDSNTDYETRGHIQVVVEGVFPDDYLSFAQRKALRNLVTWLSFRHDIESDLIAGHSDMAPGQTTCPGESLIKELPRLRAWVKEYREKASRIGAGELFGSSEALGK